MAATDQKYEFKQRVRHWAEKLDAQVVWLGVRPMRNKWASCTTSGHLNFNVELLGLKPPPHAAPAVQEDDPETRRLWKRFQVVTQLPEKDQRAVIRLINSLAAISTPRKLSLIHISEPTRPY